MRGAGRVVFAATLLLIVGTLNIIYGIGALDDANIFVNDTRFILTNLNTMGWVLIVLGVIQLGGGFSLMAGNTYGRVIGIIGGSLGAIAALDRWLLPVVVTGHLFPVRVRHSRHPLVWPRRDGARNVSIGMSPLELPTASSGRRPARPQIRIGFCGPSSR